jgi:hypothetical protein
VLLPTPNVPESAELTATAPAAIAMVVGLRLGEIVAYRDEKHGALVQNVVPVPALETSQSNGGSVSLGVSLAADTGYLPPDRIEYLFREIERVLVEAACSGSA